MVTVAIIGGGFAGMAVAIFLHKHGIESTIYEFRDEEYTSGGNIALAPNALRVLDHAGVYSKIRARGYNYEEMNFTTGTGVPLGVFLTGSQKAYNYQAIRIQRTYVRDALREQCKAKGIKVHYKKKCTSISEDGSKKVTVAFDDGKSVTADFAIGADGIHSHVRHHLAPDAKAPYFSGLIGIGGHLTEDQLGPVKREFPVPTMMLGDSGGFSIMPSSFFGEEIGYFATLSAKDRPREEWDALDGDKEGLKRMMEARYADEKSTWPEYVQALNKKTPAEDFTCWPFFVAPALDRWVSKSGRVYLIGDSAHAIPPTGGQGAAMAFEDAETLAYTLAETLVPLKHGEEEQSRLAALTSRWNAHRHARVAKVVDFTTRGGAMRKSTAGYLENVVKEWSMWAFFKWIGPEGGAQWLYEYSAENIRADLV